jgi:hypothetical protein
VTKDPAVYLRHILDCIARIEDYVREGREAFLGDTKTQDAVIRNLEVIGQAVKDLGTNALGARRLCAMGSRRRSSQRAGASIPRGRHQPGLADRGKRFAVAEGRS